MAVDFEFSICGEEGIERYKKLWERLDSNSFFRSAAHLSALKSWVGGDLYFAFGKKDREEAVMPFMVKKCDGFSILNSLPHFGTCGGLIGNLDQDHQLEMVNCLKCYAKSSGISAITLIDDWRKPSLEHASEPDYVTVRSNQYVELEDNYFEKLHYKTRNAVRKARKSGLELVPLDITEGISGLKRLHEKSMAAIGGKQKGDKFFSSLVERPELREMIRFSAAAYGNEVIAYLLLFRCGDCVEYYMPAQNPEFRSLQPMSFLIDHAMEACVKEKARVWNWGGTWESQESLRRFKIRWGSKEVDYKYYSYIFDERLLAFTPEKLGKDFEGYFVVPYEALKVGGFKK